MITTRAPQGHWEDQPIRGRLQNASDCPREEVGEAVGKF